ncbi:hypothetical protein [Dyadobacter luticola]|uniref:hypothetical protein n=1 Tax=Dyadobacter luticola TaxID=1979387 RepID=UPI001E2C8EC5|nr:hypothetical protein [Dyadobacter luticola]
MKAQHPDFFITNLIELNPLDALAAFKNQVANLKNPPVTLEKVLEILIKSGLKTAAENFARLLQA